MIKNIKEDKCSLPWIKRGDVYYADLGEPEGSEQGGNRPVIIVQNNKGNRHSPTVIVIPMSASEEKAKLPTHEEFKKKRYKFLEKDCISLGEQIRVLDKSKLSEYLGHIDEEKMCNIDNTLRISVGLGVV